MSPRTRTRFPASAPEGRIKGCASKERRKRQRSRAWRSDAELPPVVSQRRKKDTAIRQRRRCACAERLRGQLRDTVAFAPTMDLWKASGVVDEQHFTPV